MEQLKTFSMHKHSAPSTTIEIFLKNYPLDWVERYLIPSSWSANTVSILGQLPLLFFTLYVLIIEGAQIGPDHLMSKDSCLIAAMCILWFSYFDILDGIRARKAKCGSALGRVIDEAGDTICQTCYSILLAKALGWDNKILELNVFGVNTMFYICELSQLITGKLVFVTGEIGPIEVEASVAGILFFMSRVGPETMQTTVGYTMGWDPESTCPLHQIGVFKWASVIGVMFLIV